MMVSRSRIASILVLTIANYLASGHVISREYDPDSKIGDACTDGSGCNGNTECSSNVGPGYCTCKAGFKPDDTLICVVGAEVVGGPCRSGVGCDHLWNSECSSTSSDVGKCKCLPGFQGDDGSTTCYQGEVVGGSCRDGFGCEQIPNSECSSTSTYVGECKCLAGFHGEDGGTTCTQDRPSKIGDSCTDASGCNGNTECSSEKGFCTCKIGFRPDDNLSCVSGAEVLGGPCKNGVGCEQIQNSECGSSTDVGECKCMAGFHGEDGTGTCAKDSESKVGDLCKDGSGCNGNMECTSTTGSGFCTCIDGYHADKTLSCVAGPETVGSMCKNGVGCEFLANSECSIIYFTGICQCSEGYHAENGGATCTKDPEESKLGDICTDANGCYGNTECNSKDGPGFCTCKTGYHADGTLNCVAGDAIIGSACTHNLGCEKVPGLKCNGTDDQGICTCNDGFHADGEGRNCVQDVGSACNPSVGCFDPAAECKMNQMGDYTCQCREGFEAVGNICKRMDSGLHIRVHVEEAKDIDIEIDKF